MIVKRYLEGFHQDIQIKGILDDAVHRYLRDQQDDISSQLQNESVAIQISTASLR